MANRNDSRGDAQRDRQSDRRGELQADRRGDGQADKQDARQEPAPSPFEWAVAFVGAALLLATLAYLAHDALTARGTPPSPTVSVLDTSRQDGRFLVRIRVHNAGEETAAALQVTGALLQGDTVVEEADTEFQHVPGGSQREAGLFFGRDPAGYRLRLSARSYQQP